MNITHVTIAPNLLNISKSFLALNTKSGGACVSPNKFGALMFTSPEKKNHSGLSGLTYPVNQLSIRSLQGSII